MAGLETYDAETPAGNDSLNQGDNKLRELGQKIKASVDIEHHLSGEHNIPRGTTGGKPAATKDGRLYILENTGQEPELEYANGSVWDNLSKNNEVTTMQGDINTLQSGSSTHIASNPIDHQNESVTSVKVKKGHILRKHINSVDANQEGSIASLINGTELPNDGTWHTHPAAGSVSSGLVFLADTVEIASGTGATDWTTKNLTTSSAVPATAKGVILQAKGIGSGQGAEFGGTYNGIIIRKNSSGSALILIGNVNAADTSTFGFIGHQGQGIYPVDTSSGDAKLQYKVTGYVTSWSIAVVGYFT